MEIKEKKQMSPVINNKTETYIIKIVYNVLPMT